MTGGTAAISSSPLSPDRGEPGFIGRLLQRATSTREIGRSYRRTGRSSFELRKLSSDASVSVTLSNPTTAEAGGAGTQHRPAPNATGDSSTQPQPHHASDRQQARATSAAARAALPAPEMPSVTLQQPQLKKKASFRDRLKAWPKPVQSPETITEEPKPRFVYEPKHAAADFSRLAVSPMSPTRQQQQQQQMEPRRQSRPTMQTLAEDDAHYSSRTSSSHQQRPGEEPPPSGDDDLAARRHSKNSGAAKKRHSYTLAADNPFQASQAAVHVPVNSRPVAWALGEQQPSREKQNEEKPTELPPPLTDYELFLARAEAADRERREQAFRALSQRAVAAGLHHHHPGSSGSSSPRVKPDPHRQYYVSTATATATASSSATDAAVADSPHYRPTNHRRAISQDKNSGSRYALNGVGEEKPPAFRKGHHAQRASWAPSYTTGGSEAEQLLERRKKAAPVAYGNDVVEEKNAFGHHGEGQQQQHQRQQRQQQAKTQTLRRQGSFTQRIAEYIRPPKQVRPVGTLVE